MTFWEWAGAAVIAGLSGGMGVYSLKWLRESRDRKARKVSYHAMALLKEADRLCGVARAMNLLFNRDRVAITIHGQASLLWEERLPSLLNVWEANAWVLEESEKTRPLRQLFSDAMEHLRQAAVAWNHSHQDRQFPARIGARPEFVLLPHTGSPAVVAARQEAKQDWEQAFDQFLKGFQGLHNSLEPLVREYTSAPERIESD